MIAGDYEKRTLNRKRLSSGVEMEQLYNGLQYFKNNFEYYDFEEFVNHAQNDIRIFFR